MDDYGLEASGLDPDTTAELRRLRREQAIVDEMARQGMTPLQGGMVGNVYVRPSITQGLANLANSYFAGERQRKIDEDYKGMGERRKAVEQAAFDTFSKNYLGSPEKTEGPKFGDVGPPKTTPAVVPTSESKRQALLEAAMSASPRMQNAASMMFKIDESNAAKKAAMDQRMAELQMRMEDARVGREERLAAQKELMQMRVDSQREMRALAGAMRQPPAPVVTEIVKDGKNIKIDARTGKEIGEAPAKGRGTAMSATAQKELFETDDAINSANTAVQILNSIIAKDPKTNKSQNDIAYEGGLAGARTTAMGFVPGSYEGENAAVDLKNKVTGQALEQLKATFGAMPTEGERKVLLELQGSINLKAPQREAIFKRAIDLANRRIETNKRKAKSLREGTYFNEGPSQDEGGWKDM